MEEKKMITLTIDGEEITVEEGTSILEAAKKANIYIPTLCYLKDINEIGACRMCLVEIEGVRGLQASCVYPASDKMVVRTNTPKVLNSRKTTLELILSNHDKKCLTCVRQGNCELQELAKKFGIRDIQYEGESTKEPIDDLSPSIVRDPNKCILCRRCVAVCKNVQSVCAIDATNRGFKTKIASAFDMSLNKVPCVMCGQCIEACPVGALYEKDDTSKVWRALNDENKYVIVQTAPAVRAALGEEFGMPIGTLVEGKMVTALKKLGFDKVFDTNTGADFTIMEEGYELIDRIKNGGKLPLITSCSPGWVKFAEHNFPDLLENLSSCKSPHQMFGALLKSYYAEKNNINPKDIYVVSVMPCTAKKFESQREEMIEDVDAVITTRELARMIKQANIDFVNLKDSEFDDPAGRATGAGAIFGATGGVMEAALRTVAEVLEGKSLDKIEFEQVRGTEGIKEAEIEIAGMKIKAIAAHGLKNARKVMERIRKGEKIDFVEIMACPGGCVTGGGQPIKTSKEQSEIDIKKARAKALYDLDKTLPIRKSHENPFVKKVYEEYLGEPLSKKAHELFHTTYHKRENY